MASHRASTSSLLRLAAGVGLSSLTAVLLLRAFHPYNNWYLAFFAFVPMLVAQQHILPPRWSGLASAAGIGGWLFFFLSAMFRGHPAGLVIQIVVLVIVLIQIFTEPGVRRFHQATRYRWFLLQGTANWVGIEMIRSFIPPLNTHAFLAQTMYTQPWMLQPISIFGVYGLSLLLVLGNYALALTCLALAGRYSSLKDKPDLTAAAPLRSLALAGILLAAWIGLSLDLLGNAPPDPATIRAAAVQHNYPVPGHQDTASSQPARFAALSQQIRVAAGSGADLIVLPELGLGVDPRIDLRPEFSALAAELDVYLLIGYGLDGPDGWRNEAVLLTPAGEFLETYGKNHPTSPGEPPISSSGVYPVYATDLGRLAVMICNDVNWTDTARTLARGGAQLIALPTLEGPGITLEGVAQSVLRAVENRTALVKADVAYASAIIDPYGRLVALHDGSPAGDANALVADVALGSGPTVYSQLGDWVGWLSLGGFLFFVVFQSFEARRLKRPD